MINDKKSITRKNIKKRSIKRRKTMTKKKRITRKNMTKRNKNHAIKILRKGFSLYAAKKYEGSSILEYNKEQELKYNDKCLMQNSGWFGNLRVAKSYKTKDNHIYLWKTIKKVNLFDIDVSNEKWIDELFLNTKLKLIPTVKLSSSIKNKNSYEHEYLKMTANERALFEFKFCFGFIDLEKQYQFMKLLEHLIENKLIDDIQRRDGGSILPKLRRKMKYYSVFSLFDKKENKLNRLSFYDFDKHAIRNLCQVMKENGIDISGVYQKDTTSFWFPNLIVYKMNIEEYILFNPQDELKYVKMIE